MKKTRIALTLLPALLPTLTSAGDWPQILGPERNGVATDEQLLKSWPKDGPKQLWSHPLGEGFAGPVILGERVIAFHHMNGQERIEALDTLGKSQWTVDFPSQYRGGINPDAGPRATPVIADGAVFAMGASGQVYAIELASGKTRWTRNAAKDFRAQEGYFGFGSSPIVIDGNVLINVGGDDAGIVAFNAKTGDTIWKATDHRASYSSPVATTINGKSAAIFITRLDALALDATSGKIFWSVPFGARGPTVNGAAPLLFDETLFLSASYRVGAQVLDISGTKPRSVWANDRSLSSQYSSAVHHAGFIYGSHGREDIPPAHLRCIDAKTGEIKWSEDNHGVTHVLRVGEHLLCLTIEGKLSLVELNSERFVAVAEAEITDEGTRAVPALADGVLYLRTTNDGRAGMLMALEVGE